jgi:hypothetical protein
VAHLGFGSFRGWGCIGRGHRPAKLARFQFCRTEAGKWALAHDGLNAMMVWNLSPSAVNDEKIGYSPFRCVYPVTGARKSFVTPPVRCHLLVFLLVSTRFFH